MRRRSKKMDALYREWSGTRQAFLAEFPSCWVCGGPTSDCHEICGGSSRTAAFQERATWMSLCRQHHDEVQGTEKPKQLALKLREDKNGFDLVAFHRAWGRVDGAISALDIAVHGGAHGQNKDIRDKKFGQLSPVLSFSRKGQTVWRCVCDCGKAHDVQYSNLANGSILSCGCNWLAAHTKHGRHKSAEHSSWSNMKQRCCNPSYRDFRHWGGRGIKVCDRWLESFENFLADMGEKPEGTSLDRINNDGNYEPNNCRWATPKEQTLNRRPVNTKGGRTRSYLTIGEETRSIDVWVEVSPVSVRTIYRRLRLGWSDEEAVFAPKGTSLRTHERDEAA